MVLASGLASLFWAAITLALPSIHRDLGATLTELQWTATGAGLAFSATLILAGRLGDVHGHRRLLSAGFVLLALSSAAAGLAPSVAVLIAAVAVMGAAAAILTVVSLAVVTEMFGADRRAAAIAVWGGAGALAYGLGPAVGGFLAHAVGWRWIFFMYVPITLVALVLSRMSVHPSQPAKGAAVDVRGALLLGAGLVGLSLALSEGDTWGWTAAASVALLVGGIVLLAAFFLREHRATSPLVDLGLFRIHAYLTTNIVLFCVNFVLGALLFFVPLFLQEAQGDSALSAGLQLLPLSAAMLVAMPFGGRLAERGHARGAIAAGVAVAAAGAWLLSDATATTSFLELLPIMVVLGLGIGVALTPINLTAMNAVPPTSAGTASGVLGTSRGLGTAIGVAASAALFQHLNLANTVDEAGRRGVTLTTEGRARSMACSPARTPRRRRSNAWAPTPTRCSPPRGRRSSPRSAERCGCRPRSAPSRSC